VGGDVNAGLIRFASGAARSPADLNTPKWAETKTNEKAEGLGAPLPDAEYSWLDLKARPGARFGYFRV
jgi:hypothetical protein